MNYKKTVLCAIILITMASVIACKKKDNIEAFAAALSCQYKSYRIIKENRADPARAGALFTDYLVVNRARITAAYRKYYEKYGDGSKLTEREIEFLDREMEKVRVLLDDAEIRAVMEDPSFVEKARIGLDIMRDLKADSR